MARSAAQAMWSEKHESRPFHNGRFDDWSEKRSAKHPYRFDEGVTVWVSHLDLSPHDHFLGGKADCPDCSPEVTDGDTP